MYFSVPFNMIPKVFLERKCNPFCFIFSEFTQKNPMDYWLSFLKPGGILLMHDNHVYFPDVQKYVKKLIESKEFYHMDQVDTLAVFIKREKQ